MARFNLADYETVESRIRKFYELHDDGRIITEWENHNRYAEEVIEPGPRTWVVKASVYLTAGDQANSLPKATGYASETDGTGGANNVAALPNAETSAIGRALANMNLSGNKRASLEEMQKVQAISERDWVGDATKMGDVTSLRWLYSQAKAAGVPADQLERIEQHGKKLSTDGEGQGVVGGV
jgi:hypothetical protein